MIQSSWVLYTCLVIFLLGGCSLVIDVEPDCHIEDCGGYQCNNKATECLFFCETNAECAEGFSCNSQSGPGQCVATGCLPTTGPVAMLVGAESSNGAAFATDGTWIATAYNTPAGLSFQLYQPDGTALSLPLILDGPSRTPRSPDIEWNGEFWAVVWAGNELVDRSPQPAEIRDALRFATFTQDGTLSVEPISLWINEGQEKSVDAPSLVWDQKQSHFLVSWASLINTTSDLFILPFTPEATSLSGETLSHDMAVQVTLSEFDIFEPTLILRVVDGAQPNLFDLSYREGRSRIRVMLKTINSSGESIVGDDIEISLNNDDGNISNYGYTPITTGFAGAFTEESPLGSSSYRVQILPDRSIAGEARYKIGEGLAEHAFTTVASYGNGEYGVLFTAKTAEDLQRLYLTRYQDDGAIIGATVDVSPPLTVAPEHLILLAMPEGYIVVYTETGGSLEGGIFGVILSCNQR